jgi:hypothetical protein
MNWTTEKPTQVGEYWFRKDGDSHPHPVKIYNAGVVFYVSPLDDYAKASLSVRLEDCSGEFAGPMEPPTRAAIPRESYGVIGGMRVFR